MTLQAFLARIGPTSQETLRRAMTAALSVERPSSPAGFARFYQRVVSEIDRPVSTPDQPEAAGDVRAA